MCVFVGLEATAQRPEENNESLAQVPFQTRELLVAKLRYGTHSVNVAIPILSCLMSVYTQSTEGQPKHAGAGSPQ